MPHVSLNITCKHDRVILCNSGSPQVLRNGYAFATLAAFPVLYVWRCGTHAVCCCSPTPTLLQDTYFTLMPAYQGLPSLDVVKFKRVLFGGFPCYHSSGTTPLAPAFDRVLQLGDASASQSPLSFGGFGSLLRHLPRLSGAISHALQDDKLSQRDLSWIHPYQPSLSAAWLFQRSMSLQVGQLHQQETGQPGQQGGAVYPATVAGSGQQQHTASESAANTSSCSSGGKASTAAAAGSGSKRPRWLQLPADHINALLGANFTAMAFLGQRVLKPFLQDTLQLGPLAATMAGMMFVKPLVIARVFVQVRLQMPLGLLE